jgi:aryl-alcohol dehydrogenase-like predicted oxidoreductase
MKYRLLGKSGLRVSEAALGTMRGHVQTTRRTAKVASSVWQPLEKSSMELKIELD